MGVTSLHSKVFEEHISGAKKNEERPVLCQCLDYCIDNHIDTLLISELSRLGRNVDEVLAMLSVARTIASTSTFRRKTSLSFSPMVQRIRFLIYLSLYSALALKWSVRTSNSALIADVSGTLPMVENSVVRWEVQRAMRLRKRNIRRCSKN